MQLFSPNGRSSRPQFFLTVTISAVLELVVSLALASSRQEFDSDKYYLIMAAVTAPFAWVQVCAAIRRLSDFNWNWLLAVPVVPVCLWSLWALADAETSAIGALALTILVLYNSILFLLLSFYRVASAPVPPPIEEASKQPLPVIWEPRPSPDPVPALAACPNNHFYDPKVDASCPYCAAAEQKPIVPPPLPVPNGASTNSANRLAGWLVVIAGPGRGSEYRLLSRINRIGFDSTMEVQLADGALTLKEHASITFDPATSNHVLAAGAGSVELNGRPLMRPAPLRQDDRIKVGNTTLIFVPFAGVFYDWDSTGARQRAGTQ